MKRLFSLAVIGVVIGAISAPLTAASDLQGKWEGAVTRNGRPWTIRMIAWDSAGGVRVCFDFPDYGLYYRCTTDVTIDAAGVRLTYTSGSDVVTLDGTLDSSRLSGAWHGLGVDAEFQLSRIAPAPPPLIEENVRFSNGDVQLVGTLVRPAEDRRYAAVVWTHGSGRQRRTADFYRDRGYLLAEHGIASLIFDKRGVGESTGDPESTLDELAGDAVAAVQFLQTRSDIDPAAVGVGGFSQGGYVSPLAAARYGRIAFVVVGAAPGVKPADQNDFGVRTDLTRRGFADADIQAAMSLRRDVLRAQETGEGIPAIEEALRAARARPWYRYADLPSKVLQYGPRGLSVLEFDPAAAWTRVVVPVLAVWGEEDALVPAARSRDLIHGWLAQAHNAEAMLRIFPRAGHGLALTSSAATWDWPRLAPGFHDLLVEWVIERTSDQRRTTR